MFFLFLSVKICYSSKIACFRQQIGRFERTFTNGKGTVLMVMVDGNRKLDFDRKGSTPEFRASVEGKKLTIFYKPFTSRSFFNISTISGKIIATGLVAKHGITVCDNLLLTKAKNYSLSVVDGENLITYPIKFV